jgi:hypothetical protein
MKYGPTVSLNNPDTIHLLMTDEFTKGGMALIGLHLSPDGETSIAKGIPATPENIAAIYQINKHMRIYIKYRGPRRPGDVGRRTCLKRDATSFAVYYKWESYFAE